MTKTEQCPRTWLIEGLKKSCSSRYNSWLPTVQVMSFDLLLKSLKLLHTWNGKSFLEVVRVIIGRRKWQPTPVLSPGNPWDKEAWWAAVYGVGQTDTTKATLQQQQGHNKIFQECTRWVCRFMLACLQVYGLYLENFLSEDQGCSFKVNSYSASPS